VSELKWILVFGADAMLVDTRSRVLENAGFKVARARNSAEAEHELRSQQIDLLLLCYTLSRADCEKAIETARAINLDVVTLVLEATYGPAIENSYVAIHYMSGPQKLLEAVREHLR
jgi:DNA-binding response OmpR family regulator